MQLDTRLGYKKAPFGADGDGLAICVTLLL